MPIGGPEITRTHKEEQPNDQQALKLILESLEEDQAIDATTINLHGKSLIADDMVVASGRSQRHVSAIAEHVAARLKALGMRVRIEGLPRGDWVLVDCGDVIIHLFKPEVREFYNLEKMWSAEIPADTETASAVTL